jgi:hypothetical protein
MKENPMWPFRSDRKIPGWRKFEDRASARVRKEFADHHCSIQKPSRSTGKRPDLFLRSKADGQRTIVEFKYCLDAKSAHISQVCDYKRHPFYAQRGILVYPKNARISEAILKKLLSERSRFAAISCRRNAALSGKYFGLLHVGNKVRPGLEPGYCPELCDFVR